jgi:ligand-binding SRPBCC domain-containing protein
MTARSATITRTTRLAAPADAVWSAATRMPSINAEIGPWLKMTAPREAQELSLDDPRLVLGEPIFTSWILLLGLVPVERMEVTIVELERGRRFVEQSRVSVLRKWRHEREVVAGGDRCLVTDRLTVEAPVRVFTPVVARLVGAFFGHRHRRLAARFGR